MGKFILFTLSCVYLIVEYVFNVNLISMLGNDSLQNYLNVDSFGRCVSSIGGTLLALRFIIISNRTFLSKFILTLFITPIVFFSLFSLQEKVVDYITYKTPDDVKKVQTFSHVYKKGFINSSVNFNKIPRKSKDKNADDYVFFTSISFWGFGYDDFINTAKDSRSLSSKGVENVFFQDFSQNKGYYHRGYLKASYKVARIFGKYDAMGNRYKNEMKGINDNVEKYWKEKENSEKDLISNYSGLKRKFNSSIKKEVESPSNKIRENFYILAGCSSSSCWGSTRRIIRKSGIDPDQVCSYSSNGSSNSVTFSTNYVSDKRIERKSKLSNFLKSRSFKCNVDLKDLESKSANQVITTFKNTYGISDYSFKNSRSFSNSNELSYALRHMAKVKYDLILPSNWHRNDKKRFEIAYRSKFVKDLNSKFESAIKKEVGFIVPLNLSKEAFFERKDINKYLDTKLGVYSINNFKMELSEEEFYINYKEKMKKELGANYIQNLKDPTFVDDLFKITIIPIIGVTFSLIFGLINFGLIIKEIICYSFKVETKKKEMFITGGIIFILFFSPLFLNNHYTNHEHFDSIFESFKETNILIAYFYKWFLNTETFIFSLSEHFFIKIPFSENNYLGK